MAYTRRPAKKAPVKRRAVPKKSVAKKVSTLARTVKKLTKVSYQKFQLTTASATDVAVSTPYYAFHLNGAMNSWAGVFGASGGDFNLANKIYVNNYKFDIRLVQASEPDRIQYTAFVVSLKDQGADSTTFDPATGALTLANTIQYAQLPTAGKVLVNPAFFNIHMYKRFTMGGRPGDQSTPDTRDMSVTIVPKQKMIVNPRGNVLANAAFAFPKDPSQNYYFLLFNDDSLVDLNTNTVSIGGIANIAVAN